MLRAHRRPADAGLIAFKRSQFSSYCKLKLPPPHNPVIIMDEAAGQTSRNDGQIAYRAAIQHDSRAIADLICQAGGGLYEFLFDDLVPFMSALDLVAAGVDATGSPLSYENCIVATSEPGTIVGVANLFPADAIAHDSITHEAFLLLASDRLDHIRPIMELRDHGSMFLNAIAVAGDFRGKGIGKRLLDRAEACTLKAGIAPLEPARVGRQFRGHQALQAQRICRGGDRRDRSLPQVDPPRRQSPDAKGATAGRAARWMARVNGSRERAPDDRLEKKSIIWRQDREVTGFAAHPAKAGS